MDAGQRLLVKALPIGSALNLALLICLGCQSLKSPEFPSGLADKKQSVVYGDDERLDYWAHPHAGLKELARHSVVALIRPSDLDFTDPQDIKITATSLGTSHTLCTDQSFHEQPSAAKCSGTLIDTDLVLTAGHCVEDYDECRGFRYVFNYHYASQGALAKITSAEVYECERLVVQHHTNTVDYAILRLDRPVAPPHGPALVSTLDEALPLGTPVAAIGFPNGIPVKINSWEPGAGTGPHVINSRADTLDYFEATLDTFDGNSGSGVFRFQQDAQGNEIVNLTGILVRGESDYTWRENCKIVNILPEDGGGEGEDATYVARAIADLCQQERWPSARLCGGPLGDGWCDPCTTSANCPAGWSCKNWPQAPEVTWCAKPCTVASDCREGHRCVGASHCEPERSDRCDRQDVWTFDSCFNRLAIAADCTAQQLCLEGACWDSPPGDTCATATAIEAKTQTLRGDLTLGYTNTAQGDCGGNGADRIYRFEVDGIVKLTAESTGFDTILHLRSECANAASQLACEDDTTPPGSYGSRISLNNLGTGTYYLFLDAYRSRVGSYRLALTFEEVCKNACTAGSRTCRERGYSICQTVAPGCLGWGPPLSCPVGGTCSQGNCIPQGEAPLAFGESYTISEDTRLVIPAPGVLANDLDAQGDQLKARLVTGPTQGHSFSLHEDGSFTYQPTGDYHGADSFTYLAHDTTHESNTTRVHIWITSINDPPLARADRATTKEDESVTIDVLANDSDADNGDTMTISRVIAPLHGSVVIRPDQQLIYIPEAHFNGTEHFDYTIRDGSGRTADARVTVEVTPVNDPPRFISPTPQGTLRAPGNALLTFTLTALDPDGDRLTFSSRDLPVGSVLNSQSGLFSWTPSNSDAGEYNLTLAVTDGREGDRQPLTIEVIIVDGDEDGLIDSWEVRQGLDPTRRDSDGDTIADGEEVGALDLPVNTDGDHLIDALDPDSDGDGVPDSVEAGDQALDTPAVDSDGDGLPDYRDPDSDNDGLADGLDNCRTLKNRDQRDLDSDGIGDLCDALVEPLRPVGGGGCALYRGGGEEKSGFPFLFLLLVLGIYLRRR